MGNWVEGHGLDALLKTLCVVVVAHIVFLIIGAFAGNDIGWFGLEMIWPHFTWGVGTTAVAAVLLVILYWLIFSFWRETEST